MQTAPKAMADLIKAVSDNKGEVNVYAGGGLFTIYHAELSTDGSVLRCRRKSDEAEIVIPTARIDAVEEIPSSYP